MPDDLYWDDILAWSERQAELLKRVAAGERLNDVDWPNIIEEIESVGRSELRTCASTLGKAMPRSTGAAKCGILSPTPASPSRHQCDTASISPPSTHACRPATVGASRLRGQGRAAGCAALLGSVAQSA